ncbi:hypothetical protein niasHS_003943 [Heterodera schachtii]|uniref:ShKT domain-containing protein n=1 Tax=Heterodera schachtii TaxID=97005 RepID=A0ABD2K422_HETSC
MRCRCLHPKLSLPSALFVLLFLTSLPFRHFPSSVDHFFIRPFCRFLSLPLSLCPNSSSSVSQSFAISFASGTKIYQHFDNGDTLKLPRRMSQKQNVKKLPVLFYPSYSFLQPMADFSVAKSHQRQMNVKKKRYSAEDKGKKNLKKRTPTSGKWEKQKISRRAVGEEKGRTEEKKPFTEEPMGFTPKPQIRTNTMSGWRWTTVAKRHNYWTSTTKLMVEDRRHRSVSKSVEKSAERREKLTNGPSSKDGHRVAISSSNKMRKGAKTTPNKKQQQKSGGKASSNWRELSSTEQSISLMLRCQNVDTRQLLPSATTCRNLRSDKVCNYLFKEIDTRTGQRDIKCNLQGLEDIAESCRKTCGICCEDINYACEDDQNGVVDCSRQLDKCHQKKWFGVLSRFCAGSCGLCAMSTCRDYDNSCRVRKSLCLKQESLDYMRENCARTCGFCVIGENSATIGGGEEEEKGNIEQKGDNTTKNGGRPVVVGRPPKSKHRLVVPECTDKVDNCTTNAHLCNSPSLGEYMIKFCTKTCLKCGEALTSKANGVKSTAAVGPPPIELIIEPMMETNNEKGRRRSSNRNNSSSGGRRECVDRGERCIQWKGEGLCDAKSGTTKFNKGQRRACAKTCGDCK